MAAIQARCLDTHGLRYMLHVTIGKITKSNGNQEFIAVEQYVGCTEEDNCLLYT